MASVPDHRKRNTFMSYVAPPLGDFDATGGEWCLPNDMRDVLLAKPRLLSNELVVASAPAYLYPAITPIDNELNVGKEAVFGLLSVTNFKLAFVPLQHETLPEQECYQEHLFLQRNEVTLNNIDHIYQLGEGGRVSALSGGNKRKKLNSQQKVISGRIAALHIICKNFRLLKFAFQQSKAGRDYGKLIASALARFAYPSRHDLSFAFCYREPYYSTLAKNSVTMYSTKNDWARELIRCGATEWQVISSESVPLLQNRLQASKYTLPPNFVIPKCCGMERFIDLSRAFCDSRAAFWVYGYGSASLVRLAELKQSAQQDTKLENIMLELVRKCDERRSLKLLQLTDRLPSVQDVQRAYLKFRRLCTPESPQQFLRHDTKFLSLLENSNWLFYVSLCLRYSCEAAESLREGTTCVLQESNGRDLCGVVSSLTQIILDPLFRSIDGFQSLIQKEWVALEHPFQTRLGHVRSNPDSGADEDESPVFLLFLDCVWQLLQQFPDEFEYSQTYLTTLWDSCFMPIFDTFQFDTETQRAHAARESKLILRPIWDWSEQFAEKDKVFFTNPFYQRQRYEQHNRRSMAIPAGAIMMPGVAQLAGKPANQRFTMNPQLFVTQSTIPKDRYLEPQHRMSELAIWEQCYYRWMPVLEIKQGGFPQIDLQHRLLLSNISKLQRCLELQNFEDLPDIYYELTGETRLSSRDIGNERESAVEFVDGVERRQKSLPSTPAISINGLNNLNLLPAVSSFFPFSTSVGETQQLNDILTSSNELLLDGSIMDRMSIG